MESQTIREFVEFAHLGQVLHQVRDAVFGSLSVGHSVRPEWLRFLALYLACLVPKRHAAADRQPRDKVVVNPTPLGKLSDPRIATFDASALAPCPEPVGCLCDVVWTPRIILPVREGHKVGLVGPEPIARESLELTR